MKVESGKTLGDLVALNIGQVSSLNVLSGSSFQDTALSQDSNIAER